MKEQFTWSQFNYKDNDDYHSKCGYSFAETEIIRNIIRARDEWALTFIKASIEVQDLDALNLILDKTKGGILLVTSTQVLNLLAKYNIYWIIEEKAKPFEWQLKVGDVIGVFKIEFNTKEVLRTINPEPLSSYLLT